jgi:hypothetical protein
MQISGAKQEKNEIHRGKQKDFETYPDAGMDKNRSCFVEIAGLGKLASAAHS